MLEVIGGIVGVMLLIVLPAIWVARLAQRKGRSSWLWLISALVFPWISFLVATVVLRPLPDVAPREEEPTLPGLGV